MEKTATVALVKELHDNFNDRLVKLEKSTSSIDPASLMPIVSTLSALIDTKLSEFKESLRKEKAAEEAADAKQEAEDSAKESKAIADLQKSIKDSFQLITNQLIKDRELHSKAMADMCAPKKKTGVINLPSGKVSIEIVES